MKKRSRNRAARSRKEAAGRSRKAGTAPPVMAGAAPPVKNGDTAPGIRKRYLLSKKVCKVNFRLPRAAARDAGQVHIVGDFNGWDRSAHPLKKLKSGEHSITIDLEPGREYRYRYLIDGVRWENDWHADRYEPSPYLDSDNSIVAV